jgi:hypothetical protein
LRFALSGSTSTVLAGKLENQVAASVMCGHDGHRAGIYYLAVAPAHQGKGFGRAIHDAAVAWLQARGAWKINLMVRADNEAVRGFYRRLGYVDNNVMSFGMRIGP